jgi:hypothetical protein
MQDPIHPLVYHLQTSSKRFVLLLLTILSDNNQLTFILDSLGMTIVARLSASEMGTFIASNVVGGDGDTPVSSPSSSTIER